MDERFGTDLVSGRKCPFCLEPITLEGAGSTATQVDCKVCGIDRIDATAATMIKRWQFTQERWAAASYQIRRLTDRRDDSPFFTQPLLRDILEAAKLPMPAEALDRTVIWLVEHSRFPGEAHRIEDPQYRSIFGAVNADAFNAYVAWLAESGWITATKLAPSDSGATQIRAKLSPSGWRRYADLTTSGTYSREAFTAMTFGDVELDAVFKDHFVPAVDRAGFRLRRNIDAQPAGLIDDLMRVQIRTSRFVIADLTHHNRGAYWEGGFAEGLSKPVIYTCRADVFKASRSNETHTL
jgi:hypothetical protein